MKKITYRILGAVLMLATAASCFKTDNFDPPSARLYGRVIDSYTGDNLLASQGDWGTWLWERSWTATSPTPQGLVIKQDGTFNNSKLFPGTYEILPWGGPFWPIDTIRNVVVNDVTEQNFTVTPYLQLTDFQVALNGLDLTMSCRINAPIRTNLPVLVGLHPFLSLNSLCGATNNLDFPDYRNRRIDFQFKPWEDVFGNVDTSPVLTVGPLPLKSGYTYYVRLGANVAAGGEKHNYTEIVKVDVP